jgi:hypothetical protein
MKLIRRRLVYRPAGDVVVSGLGWIAVGGAPGKRSRRTGLEPTSRGEVRYS